jgi:hypothetical protein
MATMPITGVSASDVGEVVQEFIDTGVTQLEVEKQSDGNFTVFPRDGAQLIAAAKAIGTEHDS